MVRKIWQRLFWQLCSRSMSSLHGPLEQIASSMASQDEDYYLAYEGQELVGFLAVQTVLDEMEILQIAVRADFQRLGIASQLMAAVMDWDGDIFLEVRESNSAELRPSMHASILPK